MKALKKESQAYTENILTVISNCYADTIKPDNTSITALYNEIGRQICLQSEKAFVAYLAELLKNKYPEIKGFSSRNLRRMREFYLRYENAPKLKKTALTLNWTQNSVILEMCDTDEKAEFYLNLTTKKNLSKLALISAIQSESYEQEQQRNRDGHCDNATATVCDFTSSTQETASKEEKTAVKQFLRAFRQGVALPTRHLNVRDKICGPIAYIKQRLKDTHYRYRWRGCSSPIYGYG